MGAAYGVARIRYFTLELATYLNPEKNHIPQGLLLDGQEWCGIIAVKKSSS